MFTGIVEELGRVAAFEMHSAGARLLVECETVLSGMALGASIAVNGVCLTAVEIGPNGFAADLAPETLGRSNLSSLRASDVVNLERSVTMQTRLSGHIVQGHVDGTATLAAIENLGDENRELLVNIPRALDRYIVYKGSVAIDGISLTVASIEDSVLRIAIIPHTFSATNIHTRQKGDKVNIECDVLAKHVEKLLRYAAIDSTSASTSELIFSGVKSEG